MDPHAHIRSARFRETAQQRGLTVTEKIAPRFFKFELTHGEIHVVPKPDKVFDLLGMAREFASNPDFGDHKALLRHAALRDDLLDSPIVVWVKGGSPLVKRDPKNWVMLEDWLKEHGYNTDHFL